MEIDTAATAALARDIIEGRGTYDGTEKSLASIILNLIDARDAEIRGLRAEVERLRANVLQEQAWNTKRTEQFTGTLAGTVATAEAEIITATSALTQQRDAARARLAEIRALCDKVSPMNWPQSQMYVQDVRAILDREQP